MTRAEWIAVALLVLGAVLMVVIAVKVERKRTEWAWLHPPNEDEDGVFLLEEDDPDGENSR